MGKNNTGPLPDQSARDLIERALDRTLLVEAAAGTGKTTSMINRMTSLIAEGGCKNIETMAAVTFTRKAAADLRARFQVALEESAREAADESPAGARLSRALERIDSLFIGTIHSFCARLIRERPVEARVDVEFREADDQEDLRMRRQAWEEYAAALYAKDDPLLDELDRLGLEIGMLKGAFISFAEYPDVDEWPAEKTALPDLEDAVRELKGYAAHMRRLAPTFPVDTGNDSLMDRYRRISLMCMHAGLDETKEVMEIFEECKTANVVLKNWPGGKEQAKPEKERWEEFVDKRAVPIQAAWYEHRYEPVMRAVQGAMKSYERIRSRGRVLSYQDLLLKAAALLKANRDVRAYFQERFTHLLVDEFQDTDPVQAEVMLLLAADDLEETRWQRCRPRPGALFVVGDPKQSIYRFRRADIVTYNEVKRIIESSGGEVVNLSCNFRTTPQVIEWVNEKFEKEFPEKATKESPVYVSLQVGRQEDARGGLSGVKVLNLKGKNKDELCEEDAGVIARTIRRAVDEKKAVPGDFLVVTRKRDSLSRYARKLNELGIPVRVTGGSALSRSEEVSLFYRCLNAAVQPEDPVALVAALRSGLFGVSDRALYAFKRAGGEFSFRSGVPEGLGKDDAETFAAVFGRLKRYASLIAKHPCAAAFEMVAADLGLVARAAASPGGSEAAGSLLKAMELLRGARAEERTAADLVEYLGRLAENVEAYDGIEAMSREERPVQVMNLHKVKGLEAPVVFLADPTGKGKHPVRQHIDRSGDVARGFFCIYGVSAGRGGGAVLAQPPGWEELAEREKRFLDAEEKRILYVAATRAGESLIVSQRAERKNENPWLFFEKALESRPGLEDPGEVSAPVKKEKELVPEHVVAAREDRRSRMELVSSPTYEVAKAKDISFDAGAAAGVTGEGHGMEWGSVIHLLLQAAMEDPSCDLSGLAHTALEESGLDPGLSNEVLEVVKSVKSSAIWKRAEKSEKRLAEVPVHVRVQQSGDSGHAVPAIMRGVIDLVFKENGGWVLVDYKTDTFHEKDRQALVEKYRSQLENYAKAWEGATDEKVIEAGLYFTSGSEYVVC